MARLKPPKIARGLFRKPKKLTIQELSEVPAGNGTLLEVLRVNQAYLQGVMGNSFDVVFRPFQVAFNKEPAVIVYLASLVDSRMIDQTILAPLMEDPGLNGGPAVTQPADYLGALVESGVFTAAVKQSSQWSEICDALVEGETVLLVDRCAVALLLNTRGYHNRSVEEPLTESEIKGPRDGFVENIQINASLIRRRIKDYGLRFESMKLGERSKTAVALVYIESLVNPELLREVKTRLERIKIDAILASEYIEELITDNPYSIFPQVASTERPDKACAEILEGHIAILVDNTSFALLVPVVFWQLLQSPGDYYENYLVATLIRWVRFLAFLMSGSLSSLYVLLVAFHQEMLPTALALKVAAGRQGVPFPAFLEAFLMEIFLEVMKEAGLRIPKPLGQTVSIVGTLVIGQAAVTAGLVSPLMVIVIALAAISSYAIPAYSLSNTMRMIRFPLLFLSALFGLFGYLAGLIAVSFHLLSLRSFGTAYFAPMIPYDQNSMKDIPVRGPWWRMIRRPGLARVREPLRQPMDTTQPGPPRKK